MNQNNINFSNISVIKTLGTGMLGTTYLVNYKNNKYALKVQNILPSEKNKNYKNALWREIKSG
jgi:hypothetical protein